MTLSSAAWLDLIRRIELVDVRLVALSARREGTDLQEGASQALGTVRLGVRSRLRGRTREGFKVAVDLQAEMARGDNRATREGRVGKVSARYEVVYAVPGGADVPVAVLRDFARRNSVFNVWPYWRELLHSLSGKMSLGEVLVPLYRFEWSPPGQRRSKELRGRER